MFYQQREPHAHDIIINCYHDQTDSRQQFNRREHVTQWHQVCVCPHEAGSQTHSSPHVNSDDSQQTIYNLQPARNVFYEVCFIKKEARSPRHEPTRLICRFFRPEPGPNMRVWSGLSGRPDPLRTLMCINFL